MSKSIKESGREGLIWSFLIQGGTQSINFIVTVVLARLLLPEEFGQIGMIAIFIALSQALVDGGFVSSLIRTKEADNVDFSTVFIMNLFSSFLIYLVLFLTAPIIARFYNQIELIDILRVFGLVVILNSTSLVQSTKLNKALQFKTQFKLQIPSLFLSASISVWFAYRGFGVWSIVAKDISYALFANILLWWYSRWVPSFIFDKERLKFHFNFGYKLTLTQIVNSIFDNLYNVIIGKFFSAAQLGYFTRARSLEQLPSGFFFEAFNRVVYPLLAKINDDDEKLKRVYASIMRMVFFIVTPILVYLGIIAVPFIRLLLTEKWLPAVPYFQLLLMSGIFFPIHRYNLNICNLKGRSDMVLKLSLLKNLLLFIGAFSAISFGIYGLLICLILINILMTFISAHFSGSLIELGLKIQMNNLYPILVLNIIMGTAFFVIQSYFEGFLSDLFNIMLLGLLFFVLYFLSAYVLKFNVVQDFKLYRKVT